MSDAPPWLRRLTDGSLDEVVEVQAGTLALKGGQVVACDPLVFLEGAEAFTKKAPKGDHPVFIGRVDGEIAYARLELGDAEIARWEVARCEGEDEEDEWPGYSIDTGVGCFLDVATLKAYQKAEAAQLKKLRARLKKEGLTDEDDPAFAARLEELQAEEGLDVIAKLDLALQKRDHAAVVLDEKSGGNLVAFKSGGGNGVYASFWGLDKKGRALALVTDFGLFAEEQDAEGATDASGANGAGEDGADPLDGLELGDDDWDDVPAAPAKRASSRRAKKNDDDASPGGGDALRELGGLEALAAALGMGAPAPTATEARQGPSPLFVQARDLLRRWVKEEKIELEDEVNLDDFAEAFLYKLSSLQGHRNPGRHIAEWLVDRKEVADVFASDSELEADLTR
ncbi:MAG: DUF4241 domain-containing protein [Sandaracinaceae bacterium]